MRHNGRQGIIELFRREGYSSRPNSGQQEAQVWL